MFIVQSYTEEVVQCIYTQNDSRSQTSELCSKKCLTNTYDEEFDYTYELSKILYNITRMKNKNKVNNDQ